MQRRVSQAAGAGGVDRYDGALSPPSAVSAAPDPLNPAQLEAVHHLGGPCLVLAGAGSGKTRVITHKIARLLQAGYEPGQIAAITFTNKAAQEMRERAKALVGPRAAKHLVVSTFHSLGVRMLRSDGERLGLKQQFCILDSDDVLGVLKDAGGTTDNALARRWQWTISLWKNQGLDSDGADARRAGRRRARRRARDAALRGAPGGLPGGRLRRPDRPAAASCCSATPRRAPSGRTRLRYLLVDEYQDTNAIQYELLKPLAGERAHVHRGGRRRPEHLRLARRDDRQPEAPAAGLPEAEGDRAGAELPLHRPHPARRQRGDRPTTRSCSRRSCGASSATASRCAWSSATARSTRPSARWRASRRMRGAGRRRSSSSDFAILYRANHQARVFEQKLRAAQIPYKVSGGQSFFDRAEIKDLCAWLRLLVNNDDDPAFLRAVTTPKRGIGHQTLATLGEFAGKWKTSLFEALFAESLGTALSAQGASARCTSSAAT